MEEDDEDEDGNDSLSIKLRYMFVWLQARDVPKHFVAGGYSTIKIARFSLVVLSLLSFSSVALGSSVWNSASLLSLWYGIISSGYIIAAIIFLLGLRMWYGSIVGFFIISAIVNLSINTNGLNPLGSISSSGLNNLIALCWVYLVVVSIGLMRYDKGSKLNEMLQQS